MLERLFYLSQSPEVSSRALNNGVDALIGAWCFREVLAPFTGKKVTIYKRHPAFFACSLQGN